MLRNAIADWFTFGISLLNLVREHGGHRMADFEVITNKRQKKDIWHHFRLKNENQTQSWRKGSLFADSTKLRLLASTN